jgi:hypothetical protein
MADETRTEQHAALLRGVAEYLGLQPVKRLIKTPGMRAVYRVTMVYHDRRALDSVATLCHSRTLELALYYRGAFGRQPILHPFTETRFEAFTHALQQLHFDKLHDQPNLPLYGRDLWMVERAAGGFIRSVILAPQIAQGDHAALVEIIKTHLPETLRMLIT